METDRRRDGDRGRERETAEWMSPVYNGILDLLGNTWPRRERKRIYYREHRPR